MGALAFATSGCAGEDPSTPDDGCFEWSSFEHCEELTVTHVHNLLGSWGRSHPDKLTCHLLCVNDGNTEISSCELSWDVDFAGETGETGETDTGGLGEPAWDEGLEASEVVGTLVCEGRFYNECVAG